jgi:membrane associated rhomboid family serine protease
MFPLTDATRRPARFPLITATIVMLNVLAFIWELGSDDQTIFSFTVIPAELMRGHGWLTPLSAMFLHGGFAHIAGNMLFFHAFGPAVEDAMGRGRFLIFYLLGGLAATVAQVAANPASTVPELGASGAIAAVMGAFLVTYPTDRIKVLWFFGFFVTVSYIPGFVLVGLWLLSQVLNQIGSVVTADTGGVAYAAHVGGAFFGVVTARLFERYSSRKVEIQW